MHDVLALAVGLVRQHGTDVLSAALAGGSNPNVVAVLEFLAVARRATRLNPKRTI
jgi:hypothetical protein